MGMDSGRPVQPIAMEPGIVGRRFPGNLKILSDIGLLDCNNTQYGMSVMDRHSHIGLQVLHIALFEIEIRISVRKHTGRKERDSPSELA
jgi:hypothetical protein